MLLGQKTPHRLKSETTWQTLQIPLIFEHPKHLKKSFDCSISLYYVSLIWRALLLRNMRTVLLHKEINGRNEMNWLNKSVGSRMKTWPTLCQRTTQKMSINWNQLTHKASENDPCWGGNLHFVIFFSLFLTIRDAIINLQLFLTLTAFFFTRPFSRCCQTNSSLFSLLSISSFFIFFFVFFSIDDGNRAAFLSSTYDSLFTRCFNTTYKHPTNERIICSWMGWKMDPQ